MHPYRRSEASKLGRVESFTKSALTYLLDIDHDEAINLRVLLLIEPTVCQRHLGGCEFVVV